MNRFKVFLQNKFSIKLNELMILTFEFELKKL